MMVLVSCGYVGCQLKLNDWLCMRSSDACLHRLRTFVTVTAIIIKRLPAISTECQMLLKQQQRSSSFNKTKKIKTKITLMLNAPAANNEKDHNKNMHAVYIARSHLHPSHLHKSHQQCVKPCWK